MLLSSWSTFHCPRRVRECYLVDGLGVQVRALASPRLCWIVLHDEMPKLLQGQNDSLLGVNGRAGPLEFIDQVLRICYLTCVLPFVPLIAGVVFSCSERRLPMLPRPIPWRWPCHGRSNESRFGDSSSIEWKEAISLRSCCRWGIVKRE